MLMDKPSPYCSKFTPMIEPTATTSAYKIISNSKQSVRQRRSFWIQAKRIFRKRLLSKKARNGASSLKLTVNGEAIEDIQKVDLDSSMKSQSAVQRLLAPVLQQVFPYLNIYDRIRLRGVCRLTEEIFQKSLISLPPIKLQEVSLDDIEIWTDHVNLITQLLVPEFDFSTKITPSGIISVKDWQAELIVQRIAKRVDRIEHLWLETAINGEMCSSLMESLLQTNLAEASRWRPLKMDKLTIVGSDDHDFEIITKVVMHFAPSLRHLCFRHVCMDFGLFCEEFWEAVGHCHQLKQFQYQTCRLDSFSDVYLQQALSNKDLTTLEIGGIEYFSTSVLSKVLARKSVRNLAIVCPLITFRSYLEGNVNDVLKKLDTLLVQCSLSFDLESIGERDSVIKVLKIMPGDGVLEIVHATRNGVSQAARIMSYWLEIARETERKVKLKLIGISQNRIDQAVGRLLRKCDNISNVAFKGSPLMLTRGEGSVRILDRYTWFGEDDE